MKNRLLFTTALIAAAFAVSDARAERLVVSSGEEEAVNAEMSANDNSELQGGAILNSGKLTVADGVVFNGNAGSVGGAVSTVDASGAAVIGDNVSFIGNTSAMQGGAYHNQRATSTIGDNAKFHNNTAIGYGGGAVYQDTDGREAVLTIGDNAEFKGNKSETSHGGAVMNFNASDKAEITIGKNAVFSGNSAGKTGGAVAGSKTGSARFDAVAERIGGLIQSAHASDVRTALNAATALAPEVAPMVTQSESQTVNQVFGAVSTRLSGGAIAAAGEAGTEGVSSGDNVFERVAMWIQGMFNRSELDDTAKTKGFDADSAGVAMGLEKRVNDQVKLGIGYAYTNTDIDGFMRSTDVDTHTAILYGEYKPSAWFVNGVVSYGWSDYSESKNVAGYNVNADYDATSLGLQAMTGYEMQVKGFNLTPEAGLRYVHTSQDAYTDTVDQRVSSNDSDILTGVIGAKADREFTLENEMTLRPEVRVALTYDMFNDAGGSVVTLANGAAYRVNGEALDRFGVELGAGLTAEVNDNVELSLRYEGQFRDDYTDHTGLLNAKYKF